MKKRTNTSEKGISLKIVSGILLFLVLTLLGALLSSVYMISNRYDEIHYMEENYIALANDVFEFGEASDYLTDQIRFYASYEREYYLDNYLYEAFEDKRRDKALEDLKSFALGTDAYRYLQDASDESNQLMKVEYHSAALILYKKGITDTKYQVIFDNYTLTDIEKALSSEELKEKAVELVTDSEYYESKNRIIQNVEKTVNKLDSELKSKINAEYSLLSTMQGLQKGLMFLILTLAILLAALVYFGLIRPVGKAVDTMLQGDSLNVSGLKEYRYLSNAYNEMREENLSKNKKLEYKAEHDTLTGLYNREGYKQIYNSLELDKTIFILVDIDEFKTINDTYGHAIGDKVIIRVANELKHSFRREDIICRIGGDEFAILITHYNKTTIKSIENKCKALNEVLIVPDGEMPGVSISIGMAYGTKEDTTDTLFKKADYAMYLTKRDGRAGQTVYMSKDDIKNNL